MGKELNIDERRNLAIPGDKEKTLQFCVDHFIKCAKEAISDHGYFYIALSGGSTPKAIYKKLASEEYINKIDWSKVVIFFSDERSVGPQDPESNYKMALEMVLAKFQFQKSKFSVWKLRKISMRTLFGMKIRSGK